MSNGEKKLEDDKINRQSPREYVLQKVGWKGGTEYLDRDLIGLWNLFASDTTTNLAAFEALYRIGQHWHDDAVRVDRPDSQFGLDPHTGITVPWWVIHVIGHRWWEYMSTPGAKFAEISGLEGGGQGKRRKVNTIGTVIDQFYVACAVVIERLECERKGKKISVESAAMNIGERFDLNSDTVAAHYKKFKDEAQRSIESSQF